MDHWALKVFLAAVKCGYMLAVKMAKDFITIFNKLQEEKKVSLR